MFEITIVLISFSVIHGLPPASQNACLFRKYTFYKDKNFVSIYFTTIPPGELMVLSIK